MNRLEAIGIVVVFGVIGALGLWLGLSRLWGRRRIPRRLATVNNDFLFRYGPGIAIPVCGVPRYEIVLFPTVGDPDDWLAVDPPTWDWPLGQIREQIPLFDQEPPRPWAEQAWQVVTQTRPAYPRSAYPFDVAPLRG